MPYVICRDGPVQPEGPKLTKEQKKQVQELILWRALEKRPELMEKLLREQLKLLEGVLVECL